MTVTPSGDREVDYTGTRTHFKPDPEIFEETEFDFKAMITRYREMAFLNKGIPHHTGRQQGRRAGKKGIPL